jgi:uncharacterized membrane protein YphA (DoxX/SURF4 family)
MSTLHQWPALIITSGAQEGRRFTIAPTQMAIGCAPESDIVLEGLLVSTNHALLLHLGQTVVFEDLGSTSGSWHNGVRVTSPVVLNVGDQLLLGDVELQYGTLDIPKQRSAPPTDQALEQADFQVTDGALLRSSSPIDSTPATPWEEVVHGKGLGHSLLVAGALTALVGFGIWVVLIIAAFTAEDPFATTPFDKELFGVPALGLGLVLIVVGSALGAFGNNLSRTERSRSAKAGL